MAVLIPLLGLIGAPFGLFFAAINGFLGQAMQAQAEDFCLRMMGESRGSYFLKSKPPGFPFISKCV